MLMHRRTLLLLVLQGRITEKVDWLASNLRLLDKAKARYETYFQIISTTYHDVFASIGGISTGVATAHHLTGKS